MKVRLLSISALAALALTCAGSAWAGTSVVVSYAAPAVIYAPPPRPVYYYAPPPAPTYYVPGHAVVVTPVAVPPPRTVVVAAPAPTYVVAPAVRVIYAPPVYRPPVVIVR
ncbi:MULTISPECIES: hypothetical protein [unclassified Caballeronia]|uniref:hypothetical protein n=1 Tax=unclassified Caballeronia TaxID=2646786 RepID=UPI002856F27D|nr:MULTISPECIES: hypothetical protein [unclassified Caballeronia]MDR5775820.1 hypothetical protein [Caballeronia sp. LZ002]MDR5851259.1 hypothetical protein [Caballeronia sp. LZ003]